MYKLLIVDDEPLVQVGLKSMLNWAAEDIEIVGTAPNGAEALNLIEDLQPDIVLADIKMPIMNGLDLARESNERYGAVPAFIMLTSYEEFEMVRRAISYQVVDYLVKIELNSLTLREAIGKAKARVDEHRSHLQQKQGEHQSMDAFQEKFLSKLLNKLIPDNDSIRQQAEEVNMCFDYNRYITAYCQMNVNTQEELPPIENTRILNLYSSCLNMTKEIVTRYIPCYIVSNDIRHFTLIFYFDEAKPVAEVMQKVQDAIDNALTMIMNYFNVPLTFGIGTAVSDPLDIHTSFEEAKTAEQEADKNNPIRLFSHIVGTNRRSGKDKLIMSIQDYIDENLGGKLLLNEVAEVFGLSPNYLSVLFKKSCDVGFSEYINTKKIEKAKQMLLAGDMKIYEVADALGFESAFYFSKVFKKVDGHSPREYIQSKSE